LKLDGTLWCWGSNAYGQLGRELGPNNRPTLVENETTFREVSAGGRHTCAIGVNGALYCWGDNALGQLGVPNVSAAVPVRLDGDRVWTRVSAGDSHTCAIDEMGALSCWGTNALGQLGVASETASSKAPVSVQSEETWALVSTGYAHTCAVSARGEPWCWGAGDSFQHGLGVSSTVWTPGLLRLREPEP
jgi:alpha-tubulin suppressor-like RCC1 family protein